MRNLGPFSGRVLLCLWALISLLPMIWMLFGSVLPGEFLLGERSLALIRLGSFTLEHYRDLLRDPRLVSWVVNSLLVAGSASLAQVLTASGFAYVLAKYRFEGRTPLLLGVGLLMMVPGQVLVIPLFVMVSQMGLMDSLLGVIAPALTTPFGILLMYSRMVTVPDELIEAARIDGCGELGIFFRIVMPLVAPAAATLAIFAFVGQWNSFLWPLLVLFGPHRYTLPVGLATMQGQHQIEYGLLLAGAALAAVPMMLFFLAFQRLFTRGMASGAVKG
jgi:multiple sugar transport system permease protein